MDNNINNISNNGGSQNAPNGVASLVLGILSTGFSLFSAWTLPNLIALALGIVGIIIAAGAMKKAKLAGTSNGMIVAGLVLSIIGTSIAGIGFFACTLCKAACAGAASSMY